MFPARFQSVLNGGEAWLPDSFANTELCLVLNQCVKFQFIIQTGKKVFLSRSPVDSIEFLTFQPSLPLSVHVATVGRNSFLSAVKKGEIGEIAK